MASGDDGPAGTVGIVMLDTAFPRPAGDIGNPASFDGPVRLARVPGAAVGRVVVDEAIDEGLASDLLAAALRLEAEEACAVIATSCGFLAPLQTRFQAALRVPFLSSALLWLPMLGAQYGGDAPLGILTFDADRLGRRHVPGGNLDGLAIEGLPKTGELYRVIAEDRPALDEEKAAADVALATGRLLGRAPGCRAIILECTNLAPYRAAIRNHFDGPVLGLCELVRTYLDPHAICAWRPAATSG
ncbi:aspartate/glutamate racemase family protein [Oceanibacterium hippocampi]|uniref:Asp/Glu/Hydantoin racemase n=1 Tax=Oceanibacterium hippocampi TaxID=745714 RepID=A0A1Y5TA49_9PROT|nr:aspartate/glutamate racemase family protein [Oceanibacterium hippocampi]SLN58986.1 hypothetical protein OCH7691_02601 [Oceanibacterium hippocampi]